ncbi:MAG: ATP-binding protein [Chloroflexi bacterium]|nr:ATP-binding protein [Chloroflexota bacterium]
MAKDANVDKIRKQLLKQLESGEDIDYGRILELSLELSELDEDNVRFSVDASHISRLGRELVVKKETAVSELVKNAYDADATEVTLTFEDADLAGGRLIIEDNGHGMTREQLIAGFMRISTTDKVHEQYSPKYKRLRAGRKGIGRFAAHRLGKKLKVVTQNKQSTFALQIDIDWSHFEADQDLIIISNHINEIPKTRENGTIIIIDDLEDGWTVASLKSVYRYLADLLQPFPISKTLETDTKDPGFAVKILRSLNNESEEVASTEKLVFEYALAEIMGSVDKKGEIRWSIQSQQLDINESKKLKGNNLELESNGFQFLKNVNLKAFYYIYNGRDSNYLPGHINTLIATLARDRGGIRVYRNGFRVLPYGEREDDWLRLDEESARRSLLPPYKNQNFFGFVELVDPNGEVFEETASREYLINNQGFQELIKFCKIILTAAITRVAEARGKKIKPTKSNITPSERLRTAVDTIRRITDEIEHSSSNKTPEQITTRQVETTKAIQSAIQVLEESVGAQQDKEEELLNEISMLRVLASLGLSIGQFNHEIRNMFPALLADTYSLIQVTSGDSHEKALRLKKNIQSFRTYTSYFDKSVSANARRETVIQDIGKILRSFWEVVTPACQRRDIEFPEPTIREYDLFTIPMHSSEWTSILFNLFTNSRKAIARAGHETGKILVTAGREKGKIIVDFVDNGDGILPENRERIFDAFFTTSYTSSTEAEDEDDDLLGTGLGLKILKDIVTSYNGEINLVGAPRGYVTCFRIEIPEASKEQLEAYD